MTFGLEVREEDRVWAREHVPAGALHLSINASSHIKEWPLPQWIALAKRCLQEYDSLKIVATAGPAPREQARVREFIGALSKTDSSRVVTFEEPCPITRLAAVLERCRGHVGADSGVLHLAVALGIPTLSIFRDYDGLKEWQPRGSRNRSVVCHCRCEANQVWEPGCREVAQCLAGVSADEVVAELRSLLARENTATDPGR
jgi:ADP-heptose:LPS heptosyltransferase